MTGLLSWATDIHLDHVQSSGASRAFGQKLRAEAPDSRGLVVSGDIAEADCLRTHLLELQAGFSGPVYFVLGNHDYYRGSFDRVDAETEELTRSQHSLVWLTKGPISLDPGVALVGNEGWYDARHGDEQTPLALTDFVRIADLFEAQDHSRLRLLECIRARADASAATLRVHLEQVLSWPETRAILVVTHIPPYRQAAWHRGKTPDEIWAPFFSSRATGDVLSDMAARHPQITFRVLCGHTHSSGVHTPRDNLIVYTGAADYGAPASCGQVTWSEGDEDPLRVHLHHPHA
jgi:predicted phosphohydrolase